MPVRVNEIIDACQVIASQEEVDVCITESLKGAGIAACGAFVGGLCLGPPGIAVGGTIGSFAGASMCKSYKPLWQVLSNMSEADKVKLANHMLRVVQSLEISDGILLMSIIAEPSSAARQTIARELVAYFGASLRPN